MRFGLVFCAAFVMGALGSCAHPGGGMATGGGDLPSDNLAAVISDVAHAQVQVSLGDISVARTLPHDIEVLSNAIESGQGGADGVLLLRLYRARAGQLLNECNRIMGLPVDRTMAESTLADYEALAKAGGDDEPHREMRSNAIYGAAQVLLNFLNDQGRAYAYFSQCADLRQAGCMNVMAEAKLSGAAGVKPDIKEALALHVEVYKTGMNYMCAGVFSARAIARIVHFTGVRPNADDEDEYDWMRKAYRLLDQIKIRTKGLEPCGSASYQIDEYLMRLEVGDKRPMLLNEVLMEGDKISNAERTTIRYLREDVDDREYRSSVVSDKTSYARCEYAFLGLWKSAISKRLDEARSYRSMMQDEKAGNVCGDTLLFSRKFLP